tara:strand:+ start:313 stop:651 length:339 start_codon:yes stop_codon:yes gene_type:complete
MAEKFTHWLNPKQVNKTKSTPTKGRSQFAKGYSKGVESGVSSANKQRTPRENFTGKKPVSNFFNSKEYKQGFNKGRVEAVKTIKNEVVKPYENSMDIKRVDILKGYANRKYK